jgi:hypothetical protein
MTPARPHPGRSIALGLVAVLLAACAGNGTPSPSAVASGAASPSTAPSASAAPSAALSPSPSSAGASNGSLDAQLSALADQIVGQVAAIRQLGLESTVTTKALDQAGLEAFLVSSFKKDNPPAEIAAQEGLWKRMGLLPQGASLTALNEQLLGSQVLGLYDPETKALYVVARNGDIGPLERFTMSHELDHALQDQHFDLQKLDHPGVFDQGDRSLAHTSVAEGDASLLMTQWALQNLTPADLGQIVQQSSDPAQQQLLASMPPILAQTLQFPYSTGLTFVTGIYQAGGWKAVDALYANPPASTEQVMHPEKYLAHEAPVPVSIDPALAGAMGSGWKVAMQDTMGEFQLGVWLKGTGASDPAAATLADAAAAGWGGDRVAYLTGPGGADVAVLKTTWDTPKDTAEFLAAAKALTAGSSSAHLVVPDPASPGTVWVLMASDAASLCRAGTALGLGAACGA